MSTLTDRSKTALLVIDVQRDVVGQAFEAGTEGWQIVDGLRPDDSASERCHCVPGTR